MQKEKRINKNCEILYNSYPNGNDKSEVSPQGLMTKVAQNFIFQMYN